MYKTVRQGETSLQYRVVGGAHRARASSRRRRHRIACVLVVSMVVGCVTVAAAVIVPVVLTANLVGLPARLQTFAVSTKHGITRYIAILPVRDARFKLMPKPNFSPNETSLQEWQPTHIIWKELGERRLWLPVLAAFCLAVIGVSVVLLSRRWKQVRTVSRPRGLDGRGALLAEPSDEET